MQVRRILAESSIFPNLYPMTITLTMTLTLTLPLTLTITLTHHTNSALAIQHASEDPVSQLMNEEQSH